MTRGDPGTTGLPGYISSWLEGPVEARGVRTSGRVLLVAAAMRVNCERNSLFEVEKKTAWPRRQLSRRASGVT
jgi:hypothetical protein